MRRWQSLQQRPQYFRESERSKLP